MALIEVVKRRAAELGLIPKVLGALPKITLLLIVASVSLMMSLPFDGQFRRTYISENALMPSQAYSYYRESEWNILRGYRSQMNDIALMNSDERNTLVSTWLQEFGVKSAIHHDSINGDTLYGVFHAPRGDGTEAMVLSAPWFDEDGVFNAGGVSLTISLARYFSRWPVWSKNIIVQFSDNPTTSARSWLEAYHSSLDLTGGSIEAALILNYPGYSDHFTHLEVHYNGLNGELPNLDLVNVVVTVAEHEGAKVSLQGMSIDQMYSNSYFGRSKTLFTGIKNLALAGVKKGQGNEVYSGWKIQAVSLKAVGTEGLDITTFGRIPEAAFRSINNLLEKFHQSFFFYFLLAPRHFISIGTYLPSAVILSITFALSAIDNYVNNKYSNVPHFSYDNIIALAYVIGAIMVSFVFSQVMVIFPNSQILVLFNVALTAASLSLQNTLKLHEIVSYRIKSFAFIYLSLVLTSLLVINFPLAFGIGVLAFPLTLLRPVFPLTIFKTKMKNWTIIILTNPFLIFWLICMLFDNEFSGMQPFDRLLTAWDRSGSWTWFALSIGMFPVWLLLLISNSACHPTDINVDTKKSS